MMSLASAAAAFEADEFAKLPHDEQMRKLRFDLRMLRDLNVDLTSAVRSLRRRVDRLEGTKLPRS